MATNGQRLDDYIVPLYLAPYTIPTIISDANAATFIRGSFQPHLSYVRANPDLSMPTFYSMSMDPFAFFVTEKQTQVAGANGAWSGPYLYGDTLHVWTGGTTVMYRTDLPSVLGGPSPLDFPSVEPQTSLYNSLAVGGGFGGGFLGGAVNDVKALMTYDNFDYIGGTCNMGAGLSFAYGGNHTGSFSDKRDMYSFIQYVTLTDGSQFDWNCPKVYLLSKTPGWAVMLWQDQNTSRVYRAEFPLVRFPSYPAGQCPNDPTNPVYYGLDQNLNMPNSGATNERVTFDDPTFQTEFENAFAAGAAFQKCVYGMIMTGLPARFGLPQGVAYIDASMKSYSYVNFIPQNPDAQTALNNPGQTYSVARDLLGVFYFKAGGGSVRKVFHSYGIQIPQLYPGNQQPISLPCYNTCIPTLIDPVEGA